MVGRAQRRVARQVGVLAVGQRTPAPALRAQVPGQGAGALGPSRSRRRTATSFQPGVASRPPRSIQKKPSAYSAPYCWRSGPGTPRARRAARKPRRAAGSQSFSASAWASQKAPDRNCCHSSLWAPSRRGSTETARCQDARSVSWMRPPSQARPSRPQATGSPAWDAPAAAAAVKRWARCSTAPAGSGPGGGGPGWPRGGRRRAGAGSPRGARSRSQAVTSREKDRGASSAGPARGPRGQGAAAAIAWAGMVCPLEGLPTIRSGGAGGGQQAPGRPPGCIMPRGAAG